jgi:tetratricopeptide (TPR) repeat protein
MTEKSPVHIEQQLLLRYAMSAVPIAGAREDEKPSAEDIRYIEQHLKECSECRRRAEVLKEAVVAGDRLLSKIVADHSDESAREAFTVLALKKLRPFLFPAAATAVALTVLSIMVPPWFNPPFATQATVHQEVAQSLSTVTRSVSPMSDGAGYFEDGEYEQALGSFRVAASSANESSERGLAHLNLGLTFLRMAEHRQLGLFYTFDQELADSALTHLAKSLELSAAFPPMQETAYYFLAKAHLMRNDPRSAGSALQACIDLQREKAAAAQKLLDELSERL